MFDYCEPDNEMTTNIILIADHHKSAYIHTHIVTNFEETYQVKVHHDS